MAEFVAYVLSESQVSALVAQVLDWASYLQGSSGRE
jgi:hypothetical protein